LLLQEIKVPEREVVQGHDYTNKLMEASSDNKSSLVTFFVTTSGELCFHGWLTGAELPTEYVTISRAWTGPKS
jgi:hypothetical protein